MTTHKDYLDHSREQAVAVTMRSSNNAERQALEADIEAFLANGGKIKVLEGFERASEGNKPFTTLNAKKMSERENRERMKRQVNVVIKEEGRCESR